jgi:hypothetical protein
MPTHLASQLNGHQQFGMGAGQHSLSMCHAHHVMQRCLVSLEREFKRTLILVALPPIITDVKALASQLAVAACAGLTELSGFSGNAQVQTCSRASTCRCRSPRRSSRHCPRPPPGRQSSASIRLSRHATLRHARGYTLGSLVVVLGVEFLLVVARERAWHGMLWGLYLFLALFVRFWGGTG